MGNSLNINRVQNPNRNFFNGYLKLSDFNSNLYIQFFLNFVSDEFKLANKFNC